MTTSFAEAMEHAVRILSGAASRDVTLVHHNDTDGLSSGTILLSALEQSGYHTTRFSLEKPYPQVLESLLAREGGIIIFADFAGRIAPLISRINQGRNLVIILDHHPASPSVDPSVINLDGELHGLKGDRDISASATCYLFAETLLRHSGKSAVHLSHLGVLGAIGDGFLVDGALSGVNRTLLETAVDNGLMSVKETPEGESYSISLGGTSHPAATICTVLDTLGGVGYYDKGTDRGIEVCRTGLVPALSSYVEELMATKARIFTWETQKLREHIHTTAYLQWFDVQDRFKPMGIKMVGVFCTEIKDMDFLDQGKFLAGFQHIPDEVPGFGAIAFMATKISMRVSRTLSQRIRAGQLPGLDRILPEATEHLGGFSDACHSLSAATTVKIGQEQALIEEIETILSKRMEQHGNR
ncbi:MAG: hypothetical protein A3J97_03785 [Spirochaetes bacterium RIFOXYC1_FULL_54_7]|nr:MAG: hypothetical protein A3J97_03785 [Spirochaetes bacterium RIFOXYC1_FULL_54_7]